MALSRPMSRSRRPLNPAPGLLILGLALCGLVGLCPVSGAAPAATGADYAPRAERLPTPSTRLARAAARRLALEPAVHAHPALPAVLAQRATDGPPARHAQRAILPPRTDAAPAGTPDARLAAPTGRKNPALAGLLSALVPGAGQAYLGSQSAYGFFGVEVVAWTAHFATKATGDAKEKEYKRYADAHWTFERYRDQNSGPCTVDGHSDGGVQDSTLVMLYTTRRNDWYEDIGKLSIYSCGWDAPGNRIKYRDMRHDSNTFLSHARTATSVILLNHLVSALLAARGAARHNVHLTRGLELDWKVTPSLAQTSGTLTLRQTF